MVSLTDPGMHSCGSVCQGAEARGHPTKRRALSAHFGSRRTIRPGVPRSVRLGHPRNPKHRDPVLNTGKRDAELRPHQEAAGSIYGVERPVNISLDSIRPESRISSRDRSFEHRYEWRRMTEDPLAQVGLPPK